MALDAIQAAIARALLALPEPILRRLAGPPQTYRGATLDPRLQLALRLGTLTKRPTLESLPPPQARLEYRIISRLFDVAPLAVQHVADRELDGVPVRIYRPSSGELPVLLFIHGGGFVIGDLDAYDPLCRFLAKAARCAVVSVAYRLAPEHPFPAAVADCTRVLEWLRHRGKDLDLDPERIAIAGDSAGGNLTAVLAQLVKQSDGPQPVLQILIYASTDTNERTDSRRDLAEGYGLTAPLIAYFRGHYRAPPEDVRISPMRADDVRGLCPALVITAGFDPFLDEGRRYAEKLAAAGVPVTYLCFPELMHGTIVMGGSVPAARRMLLAVADALHAQFITRRDRAAPTHPAAPSPRE